MIRKLFKSKPPEGPQPFPNDFTDLEKSNIKSVQPFTMTSPERLVALSRAIDHIELHKIPGDIVECGVWRGGSMMLAAYRLLQHNSFQRNLFLFDTFEGMTPPTEKDRSLEGVSAKYLLETSQPTDESLMWCIARIDDVRKNVASTGYDQSLIHLVQGPVEKTLPDKNIGKIAILRLDTDWYESTSHELNTLYDSVVPGGFIIIDDYGHWEGCRKAVDEFFAERNLNIFLHRIDYTGRIFVKP
jgi:O-methyltransferase